MGFKRRLVWSLFKISSCFLVGAEFFTLSPELIEEHKLPSMFCFKCITLFWAVFLFLKSFDFCTLLVLFALMSVTRMRVYMSFNYNSFAVVFVFL